MLVNLVAATYVAWPMLSPLYQTEDHMMPLALFLILLYDLPTVDAARGLAQSVATADGIDLALSSPLERAAHLQQMSHHLFGPPAAAPVLFRRAPTP